MTVVAIDGPAGSGKSTIAAALATRLGLPHVDTGAFYRAATLAVLRAQADPADPEACVAVVRGLRVDRVAGRTLLDGEDVEHEIRCAAVDAHVSAVARHPVVRQALLGLQRAQVGPGGAVVEGRDAGTVVVPDADLKIWLTATPETRAARRAAQLGAGPDAVPHQLDALVRRDESDATQMLRAADAVPLDTTGRSVAEIVEDLAARVLAVRGG